MCCLLSGSSPTGVGRDACRAILHTVVLYGLSLPACISFSSQVDDTFDPPSSCPFVKAHCVYVQHVRVCGYICVCVCVYICMYVCMYVSRVHPRPFSSTLKHSLIRTCAAKDSANLGSVFGRRYHVTGGGGTKRQLFPVLNPPLYCEKGTQQSVSLVANNQPPAARFRIVSRW